MMNFRHKAVFTALLALVSAVMLLASGCVGDKPQGGNTGANDSGNPVLYSDKAASGGGQSASADGLAVTGQGKTTMNPDVAYITLGVQTQDANAAKARTANDTAMAKVIAAVKALGLKDEDITTQNYSIYPYYDDKGEKLVGYRVENTASVRVKDTAKLGEVLTAASTAGANMAYGVRFNVLDQTAAYNDALGQAMDDAHARAEIMAKALGVKLGKVLSISETSSTPGPVYYPAADMALASKAGVPTSSGTVDISASVNVVYEIIK